MTLPDDNRIFEKVEIEAAVDTAAWRVHLQKYLQPFFDSTAADIPVGSYTVDVRFVVEMDGRISSVTAITDPGYGLAKVSANAIREGPRWKPGEINTCFVRSYHTQPITFMVTPDECDADTAKEAGALPPHMITPKKCEADTAGPLMFLPKKFVAFPHGKNRGPHLSGMNRLFPLFCLCVVLPFCLLLAKTILPKKELKPFAATAVQKRESKPDFLLQLHMKADAAEKFALQRGFSSRIVFLLDMRLPSGRKRFFVYDLQHDSLLASGLVAHGSCNNRFLKKAQFANVSGCGCSSIGRYKVAGAYEGKFGKAFKLVGLDSSNSNAYQRNVVLHAYGCVPDEECDPYPICNSLGCAMVSPAFLATAASFIQKERKAVLLWMYD